MNNLKSQITPNEILEYVIKHDDNYYCPGVYFVSIASYPDFKRERIVYIGSSKNMRKRTMSNNHPYRKLMNRIDSKFIVFCRYYKCDDYLENEVICINYFKPLLNKKNKNG